MNITKLRVNHLENPLGFSLTPLRFSWIPVSSGKRQASTQVEIAVDEKFTKILYDSGVRTDLDSLCFEPDFTPNPSTRYFWRVTVIADNGDTGVSAPSFFETGKRDNWEASWITASFDKEVHPLLRKSFFTKKITSARAYVGCTGVYELYINGQKVGSEYLAPGFHSYDFWLQYQTYDITALLFEGENAVGAMIGPGWYKGRFGFDGDYRNNYGDTMSLICELHLTYEDGTTAVICTDNSWLCHPGSVTLSNIYDGEHFDENLVIPDWAENGCDLKVWSTVKTIAAPGKLYPRLSPPVVKQESFQPTLIHTPAGESVLDFGQEVTGWVEFTCEAPKDTIVTLHYSEILQNDNFYRDNLRSAKAVHVYRSNGENRLVRPHFTFFGFRYVKVEGVDVNPADYTAYVLHSEMEQTGQIETSDPLINRLFLNALWGQKGNFLDVPTDCPQRDERMGWTGDAQVFAATASYNMYTPAFYEKYMQDLVHEQSILDGGVPYVIPCIKTKNAQGYQILGHSSCAWGDVAAVIPWTLYLFYGDKRALERHYPAMRDWVGYIKREDEADGGKRLWQTGFHFADWLGLDNYKDPKSPFGGTDCYFVASAYYAHSASLTADAAEVLGKKEDALYYRKLAAEVRQAITDEYFTKTGKSAIDTQTAMTIALFMNLVPESYQSRLAADLKKKLAENKNHLNTGFVGTPYLCRALSTHGMSDLAYTLLFNDDFPSWLYEVKMGATTIWERWNSVLPDGSISDTGMNSLNHYAYGSIVEWMYRNMCGINPVLTAPGFRKAIIAPEPDQRLSYAKATFDSPVGRYESGWKYENGKLIFEVVIPFGAEAEIRLPAGAVTADGFPVLKQAYPAGSYLFML